MTPAIAVAAWWEGPLLLALVALAVYATLLALEERHTSRPPVGPHTGDVGTPWSATVYAPIPVGGPGHQLPAASTPTGDVTTPGSPYRQAHGDVGAAPAAQGDAPVLPHSNVRVLRGGSQLVAIHQHDPARCIRRCCAGHRYRRAVDLIEEGRRAI